MCETCGCGDEHVVSVDLHERILAANDGTARHNREHFAEHAVLAINLMGSPGSGKTALVEAIARASSGCGLRIAALSGDLATDHDGARLRAAGIPAATITTGSTCHLDAAMVHRALHDLDWHDRNLLFIENVGNLVCPAVYDLGQAANVVALAVTEGEDKPLKYPVMFRKADLVILTKADLLPHLPDVSVASFEDALRRVMPDPRLIVVSTRTGQGIEEWMSWLGERHSHLGSAAHGARGNTGETRERLEQSDLGSSHHSRNGK
jgi:hydrogenase nickel incorporation protein HypB